MSEQLTKLESSVYQYMLDFTAEHTYQPSIRDIGKQFQIKSTKTVSDLLQSLARKGLIERDPSRSRGVRLLGFTGAAGSTPVPYYGRIHAGEPALLPQHRDGFITMDRRFLPSDRVFFLKVQGDSMIGRAIENGDFVLVDPVATPHDGDMVAARFGEESTVKTLTHDDGATVLRAANPADRDIVVSPNDDFAILGVIAGVFRPFTTTERQATQATNAAPGSASPGAMSAPAPTLVSQPTA